MGLFDKLKEPVFLKESNSAQIQLEALKSLEPKLNEEGRDKLLQDIRLLEYGIAGEKNIAFELKNSHMPMYILQDVYLESGDLSAQIDYLVFTRKLCFVIECKNLYGNIEINCNGDFVRTIEYGKKKWKEGIYSPVTQNERHLQLMKKIKSDRMGNFFTKFMVGNYFEDFNKSIVVLANPKTVLNTKYAKKDIRSKVIRADQLVGFIKQATANSKELANSDEDMKSWAESYLKMHIETRPDYTAKYNKYLIGEEVAEMDKIQPVPMQAEHAACEPVEYDVEQTPIFAELKEYRLLKSREEKIKPYFIYNNNELKDLISKMPATAEELLKVSGFGPVKAEKYGTDILSIVEKFR